MAWSLKQSFSAYEKSESELGLYRIVYALYLLVFAIPDYTWMSGLPDMFFSPQRLSPGFFFSQFPSDAILYGFTTILVISAGFLLFGVASRFFSYLIVLVLILGNSFAFSLGKIDHNFLLWMIPLILGTAWGGTYAVRPEKTNASIMKYGPGVLAFVIAFAMFTAGFIKMSGGWLLPDTQAVYGHFLREYFVNERQELMAGFFMSIKSSLFWESLDYGGVLLELLFLLAFFNRKVFRWFLVATILFHIMNFLMLNIIFIGNYAAYMLFINWGWVKSTAKKAALSFKRPLQIAGVILVGLLLAGLFTGLPGDRLQYNLMTMVTYVFSANYVILVGSIINLLAVAVVIFSWVSGRKSLPEVSGSGSVAYT
jgi:hypothetical protein